MNADEWAEIHRLRGEGMPIKGIATALAMSRNTVRRALSFDRPPPDRRRRSPVRSEPPGRAEPPARAGAPALPSFTTELVGRREELAAIRTRLGAHRLVTIAGPGGVGKTRLAVAAAHEFRRGFTGGVRLVELSTLRDPDLVAQSVLDALGLVHQGAGGRATAESVARHLRDLHLLLVIDNCEHLRDAVAAFVEGLLRATTHLRILVTSRELLDLPGEDVEFLAPLPVHGSGDATAMALFECRARDVLSDFVVDAGNVAQVRRVCERLEGVPLAIELACIRLRALSLPELADRLDTGLALLSSRSRNGEERHASMQAAIAWSYELCTVAQRRLWARCSLFAGGFDAELAVAVCADEDLPGDAVLDGLFDLVGKSVLRRLEVAGRVRFRVLEPIREFGQAALGEDERERLSRRLLTACAGRLSAAVDTWFGADQHRISESVQADLPTVRVALQYALSGCSGDPGDAVRTAAELLAKPWFLWACGFSPAEHVVWLERVLDSPGVPPAARVRALGTLGMVQTLVGDREPAKARLLESLSLDRGAAHGVPRAFVLNALGLAAFYDGDLRRGELLLDEALGLYGEAGADARVELVCTVHVHLGLLLCFEGRTAEAGAHFDGVRARCEAAGESWMRSYALYGQGLVALTEQRHDDAMAMARESLREQQAFADAVGTPLALELLGWAEAGAGSATRAAVLLGASSARWGAFGQQLYGSEQWIAQRDRFVIRTSRELGPARFAAQQARGAAMSRHELAAFAAGDETVEAAAAPAPPLLAGLSRREREVAAHVARGLSNREVAELLVLSHRTVEGHVEHVLQKLGLANRSQLAAALAARGLAQGDPAT